MNKSEIIKGIKTVISGLELVLAALDSQSENIMPEPESSSEKKEGKKGSKAVTKKEAVNDSEDSSTETSGETYARSYLEGLKYNQFKTLAAKIGVDCKGSRAEIMNRLVEAGVVVEDNEEKSDSKSDKSESVGAEKADASDEGEDFEQIAEQIIEDTPVEDILEALKDAGVKANKLNYKKKLVEALRDGKIEFGDDDESGESQSSEDEDGDFIPDSHYEDFDLSGVNDTANMSEARLAAVQTIIMKAYEDFSKGDVTADDLIEYLQDNASQEELDLLGDDYEAEDLFKLYVEVRKHFIDDEGEEQEPGTPYEVNGSPFCCGHELKYDKKTKHYICEHCATEYES